MNSSVKNRRKLRKSKKRKIKRREPPSRSWRKKPALLTRRWKKDWSKKRKKRKRPRDKPSLMRKGRSVKLPSWRRSKERNVGDCSCKGRERRKRSREGLSRRSDRERSRRRDDRGRSSRLGGRFTGRTKIRNNNNTLMIREQTNRGDHKDSKMTNKMTSHSHLEPRARVVSSKSISSKETKNMTRRRSKSKLSLSKTKTI
jgi:hypothetical protein